MTRFRCVCGSALLAAALLAAMPARATAGTILIGDGGGTGQVNFYEPTGESFTAEDPFVSAALYFRPINPGFPSGDSLRYDFYAGNGVGGSLLATETFNLAPGFNGFFDFNLSSIALTVGNRYTLVVTDVGSSPYWGFAVGNFDYANGDPILNGVVTPGGVFGNNADNTLRVTPVNGTAVPEPASLLLLGTGVIGAGLRRYRRRASDQQ